MFELTFLPHFLRKISLEFCYNINFREKIDCCTSLNFPAKIKIKIRRLKCKQSSVKSNENPALKFDSFKKVKDVINFEKRQYVKM